MKNKYSGAGHIEVGQRYLNSLSNSYLRNLWIRLLYFPCAYNICRARSSTVMDG